MSAVSTSTDAGLRYVSIVLFVPHFTRLSPFNFFFGYPFPNASLGQVFKNVQVHSLACSNPIHEPHISSVRHCLTVYIHGFFCLSIFSSADDVTFRFSTR